MPIFNDYLLRYFNTTTLLVNQIITMSLSGKYDSYTRSKNTISGDPPDFLSALSKVETNLLQNITNLKMEVINLKHIIIQNVQYKASILHTKVRVLKKKFDLKIQNNNVGQYSCRNNVETSGIPQSVSNNQLEEKVVDILRVIDVNITLNEIEACHPPGNQTTNVIAQIIKIKT